MSVWGRIEDISNDMQAINYRTDRLKRKSPMTMLREIKSRVIAEGVNHADASYVKAVAEESNCDMSVMVSEYSTSGFSKVMSFQRKVEKLITHLNTIKSGSK